MNKSEIFSGIKENFTEISKNKTYFTNAIIS